MWLYNQKRFQQRKMRWFILLTCQTLQWHQTDAPWPFSSKIGAAVLHEFFVFLIKIIKSELLLWLCNQKRFQHHKICWYILLTWQTLQWNQTDATWPFISKVGAVGYSQVLYKTVRMYETNEVLLDQWHEIRCQWG